jgi:5'(3')-deoxyribonucleotidase
MIKSSKKVDIAVDMDEVLVNISPKWIMDVYNHPGMDGKFNKEKVEAMLTSFDEYIECFLLRDSYYIEKWLEITDPEAIKLCRSIYDDNEDFYDGLPPTYLTRELKVLMATGRTNVTIVSHCVNEKSITSKRKWISYTFPDLEIKFIPVPLGTKKSDAMKANNVIFDVFIDDMTKNIRDVAENLGSPEKEFLIPSLGYNQEDVLNLGLDETLNDKGVFLLHETAELQKLAEIVSKLETE